MASSRRSRPVLKFETMRLFTIALSLAATAFALSACQTMTPEERRAADEQRCLEYGFKRGSEGMATCLQRIDLNREAEARANREELMLDMGYNLNAPLYFGRGGHYHHRH
jgi:predicted lipoprotein with Yx(FWY)xxD motif